MKPSRTIAVVVLLLTLLVSPWMPSLAQAQVALADLTALNSASVSVTYSTAMTNRQTNRTTMTATVKNISSKAVTGPVYFAIDAITPSSVTVVNAPITSAEGIPLFAVATGAWPAGASSAISMVFANPTRIRFDIQQRVLVKKAVTLPQVTITSPAPLSMVNLAAIPVTGTVSATATSVTVNGVPATINNQTWTVTVPLQEGSNTLTAIARDAAGNTGTASVQVTRDTVLPTLTATLTPLPNAAGWNNTDVTVTFVATDSLAGVASVTAPVTVTAESADHVVSGTATDRAGNHNTLDVHVRLDKTPPGVTITSPANGTTRNTSALSVSGTVSDALSGVASVTCNGTAATVSSATFTCNVSLTEGANTIHVQAIDTAGNTGAANLAVTLDTTPPQVTIETPANGAVLFASQVRVAGQVNDQTAQVSVNGQATPVSNGRWEVTLPLELGATTITAIATDGAGNTGQQSVQVTRKDVVVESITVTPVASRLSAVGAQQPLAVTGRLTDGTTQNLTAGSTGTTYASSKPFVATVTADGLVTAAGNGSTTISVGHKTFSATADITVEAGVNLTALALSPTSTTLRAVGAPQQLSLTGSFSDGSTRDLTAAAAGTTYTSSAPNMVTVSADAMVTAVATGQATITATNEQLHATTQISVAISTGAGFLRGEVYDDSTGLPLAQAVVTLLADGGGPVDPPITMTADDQGQFLLVGLAGEALVRMAKEGFTSVERHAVIPQDTAFTLLDARLTPRTAQGQTIPSATGGEVRSQDDAARLVFPPGSVQADVTVRLTVLSNQGLQNRLPLGWSPIAAVDVFPNGLALGQPVLLQVPNTLSLPPHREVSTAFYDPLGYQWIGQAPAVVTPDGQHIATEIRSTGQWVFLLPDDAPFTPPTVQTGQALQGVAPVALPTTLSASSTVVPPSAPAGDNARATGTIILETASPLPSGTRVQAHVSEQFNLLDTSRVIPLPFTQDLLTYAQPRQGETAGLSTQFPMTPSRNFTMRELALGVVHITVTAPDADIHGTVVGATGGTVTDAAGNSIELPVNGLQADRAIDLLPRTTEQLAVALPTSFALLAAVHLDLVGTSLAQTATLSIPRPADLPDTAQVIIAQVIGDPAGFRHLRLVALGRIQGTRVVSQTQVNGLHLPGITTGGQYVFLRPPVPLGFITGVVSVPGGTPQALAVVTADTAPLADVTAGNGTYIIAGRAGGDTQVTATSIRGDVGTGTASISAAEAVVTLDLMLHVVGPTVMSTTPANGAVNIPLNTAVRVQFSESLDPETVTVGSLELQQNGTLVPGLLTLSADGRTITLRPDTELRSNTLYILLLTDDLHDLAGNPLNAMVVRFTTLDTSKPPQPQAGQITAALPDDDGLVLIFGTQGTAEANSAVTATNLRTQETITVLALPDSSFRLRVAAKLGEDLALTFRNGSGKEVTTAITQLVNLDGTTAMWDNGGTVAGPQGRIASILPRALATPATLAVQSLANPSALPTLPPELSYVDSFGLTMTGGTFNRLRSLQLSESQNRFDPAVATAMPFAATGALVVPTNFLVNGQIMVAAVAEDIGGNRQRVEGSTLVVEVNPATEHLATAFTDYFPTVFLDVPQEATPNQQLQVQAIAPTARIDFTLPAPAGLAADATLLLVRLTQLNGEAKLAVVDRLTRTEVNGAAVLTTTGRELPGATSGGQYAVVASTAPLVFVRGKATGPAVTVSVQGSPFVFETSQPNATFLVPVVAGQPFTLSFINPTTGTVVGTANGQAPADRADVDLGEPFGTTAGQLRVSAQPDSTAIVDINDRLVFTFAEPIDSRTVDASLLVTDAAGKRVFGSVAVSSDGTRVTFTPSRRWRFGTTYRYGVSSSLLARSGARLPQPFTGTFTTFTPRVLGSTTVDTVQDVAVAGNLTLVGGTVGLSVLDITQADNPVVLQQVPVEGGVAGVQVLSGASFTDRQGQSVLGTLGLAASGTAATVGRLQIFGLNTPATPVLLGSAQLTVPAGQNASGGVPNAPGVPNAVAVGPDQRALVAVQGIGVESITLPQAIPDDPTNPGRALGTRYPATGFETANQVAVLKNTILVAGSNGLTGLDSSSLAKLGTISTSGNAQGVAALAGFPMDVNGDGTVDQTTEIFDLAVVANGEDGTLQFFNVSDPTAPKLLSVVRLSHAVTSVVLNPQEQLAYVGYGLQGVVIVDLAGPASVQPIDLDRNSVDDRLLGLVKTPGTAGRLALNLARGVGYVADGTRGLTVVQLIPPRTVIEEVRRDPVAAATGDEQSILETRTAFVTDDALQVTVHAVIPPQSDLFLSIEEAPQAGSPRVLAFPDGTTSTPLVHGVNTLTINVSKAQPTQGSQVTLKIQEVGSSVISRFALQLTEPDLGNATLEHLFLAPQEAVIPANAQTVQLSVGGLFSDGRVLNLTAASSGTTYTSGDLKIATVDNAGRVTAIAGGSTEFSASNQKVTATGLVSVEHPPVLTSIKVSSPYITLTAPGAQQVLHVTGRLTDGTLKDVTQDSETRYSSSISGVVTVDGIGMLTAIGEGTATVTMTNGGLSDQVQVAVEFRIPPNIIGIDLAPFTGLITTDQAKVLGRATIRGTGSLDGLTVTFTLSGGSSLQVTGITDYSGAASVLLTGLVTAGNRTVTASVMNPTTGGSLSDAEVLVVEAGSGDYEPNNDLASASRLAAGRTISGVLDGTGDPRDAFRMTSTTGGALSVTLSLQEGTNLSDVTVVVLSGDGTELGRFTPLELTSTFTQKIAADQSFLVVETTGTSSSYTLSTSIKQAPLVITSVNPTNGGPGTLVTITGSGFRSNPGKIMVLFGTIAGKVVSATPTQIQALVPANAVNGPLAMVVGSQRREGPQFTTGIAGPPPPITFAPPDPAKLRLDPITGKLIVVNRLLVDFDPVVSRSEAETLATSLGGTVVGHLPTFNAYIVDFITIQTITALEAMRHQWAADPRVLHTTRDGIVTLANAIDTRDKAGNWSDTNGRATKIPKGNAYKLAKVFDATEEIRATSPFNKPKNLREVTVAIIDTGFDQSLFYYKNDSLGITNVVTYYRVVCPNDLPSDCIFDSTRIDERFNGFTKDHGTEVTSVIAAINDGIFMSGVLSGIYQFGENPKIHINVYGAAISSRNFNLIAIYGALEKISKEKKAVVNMSFGATDATPGQCQDEESYRYKKYFRLNPDNLIVVSAGNENMDASSSCPGELSQDPELGRVDELFNDNPHGDEMNQSQKGLAQFLIPCSNTSKLLEAVEEPFHLLT